MKRFVTLVILLNVLTMAHQAGGYKNKGTAMSKNAQAYITAFERGENFVPPAQGVFVDGRPDDAALDVLGTKLEVGSPNVRENIVKLLVDMGRSTDPLTKKGADVLRHPRIIGLLAFPGLARQDLGREAAMEALRKLVTQRDLARLGDSFTKALAKEPTEEAFLLVAKAKPAAANEVVERLMMLPRWQNVEAARIAHAALGYTVEEDRFLADAAAATNGEALARAIGPLGLMGTPRSLKLVGEFLRTPFTIEIPGSMPGKSIRSARLDVLGALLYNFPDQPALYPNNINQDEDYRTAEHFCMAALRVAYKDPAPPYLKYGNMPP